MNATRMCMNCGLRPCHGRYPYCGKSCADQDQQNAPVSQNKMCSNCNVRPALAPHAFCSRSCGQVASTKQQQYSPRGTKSPAQSQSAGASWSITDLLPNWPGGGSGSGSGKNRLCRNCKKYPAFQKEDYCSRACENEDGGGEDDDGEEEEGLPALPPTRRATMPPPRRQPMNPKPIFDEDEDDRDLYDDPHQGLPAEPPRRAAPAQKKRVEVCMFCREFDAVLGEFCSSRCKADAKAILRAGGGGKALRRSLTQAQRSPSGPPPPPQCRIPQCDKQVFTPGSRYCSNKHRELAVTQQLENACINCKKLPRTVRSLFCSASCQQAAEAAAPTLLELPSTDPKFVDVKKQFDDTWSTTVAPPTASATGKPNVTHIYKVMVPNAIEIRYKAYRDSVETNRKFVQKGAMPGNEIQQWRGVTRACAIGDNSGNIALCATTSCGVCSVLRNGFALQSNGYAQSIYSHPASSTAHGYTSGATRAVFLNRVVVGSEAIYAGLAGGYVLPGGADSLAQDAKRTTNWVYRTDAICPTWLVLYS